MNQFLDRLEQQQNWKETVRTACRLNHINTSMANDLTIAKLRILNERFNKIYENLKDSSLECWLQSELKAFNWILLAISGLQNVKIEEFNAPQWTVLAKIFKFKTMKFLRFQTRRFLVEKKTKNKNWQPKQKELLKQIVQSIKFKQVQWTEVAHLLFEKSKETYFRTAKHCRERWLNQLDPEKNRNAWTITEDLYLLNQIDAKGKKWAELAGLMNRNEHAVKNRFNSLVAKIKKKHPNIRKQQNLINMIKKQLTDERQKPTQNNQDKQDRIVQVQESLKVEQQRTDKKVEREKLNNQNFQVQAFQGLQSLQHIVKEQDEDLKSRPEYPQIVSPFWTYSPKNLTPSGFLSSPSPLWHMRFSFTNCHEEFTGAMSRMENDKADQKNITL